MMRFSDVWSRIRRALPSPWHWHLIVACAVAVAVAGCASAGTPGYDTAALARTIRKDLGMHPGFHVVSVSCPKRAKLAKGVVVAGFRTGAVRCALAFTPDRERRRRVGRPR